MLLDEEVVGATECLCCLWRKVASNIGLSEETVESISQKSTNDLESHNEAISMWLRKAYDWKRHGCPSWRMLSKAVNGMEDYAVAFEIACQHKGIAKLRLAS